MDTKITSERLATVRPGVWESLGTWSWFAQPATQTYTGRSTSESWGRQTLR